MRILNRIFSYILRLSIKIFAGICVIIGRRVINLRRLYYFYYWEAQVFSIGENTKIYGKVKIYNAHLVSIGDFTTLNDDVIIIAKRESIVIGDNVRISAKVMIIGTGLGDDSSAERKHFSSPIIIENNAWIGAGAIILPGVKVGANSIVAAGAVVTRDVEPNSIVGGVPASTIKYIL
jgi:acetyltransferase-like isoleucine patch superfamily enzyme